MSAIGNNPKVDFLNLRPQSADPSNPQEGDVFYSDGTSRVEGPWVYQNGVWAQFSTGAAITVVNNLTLTPQASDPGSPTTGMLFYSNGTSRAAGLWVYNGSSFVQITGVKYLEFTHKPMLTVRVASTANVTLANQVENGDSLGGVTLVTGDRVLLKNQSTASENGVYIVQVSGAPIRAADADSASELSYAQVYVTSGTNANTIYWQTSLLSSLSDSQTWGTSAPTFTTTVPAGVFEMQVDMCGGGGGAGAGAANNGGGGDGGAGATPQIVRVKTTPGDTLTINVGTGGLGGLGATSSAGGAGANGTASTVTGTGVSVYAPGGAGGAGGQNSQAGFGTGTSNFAVNFNGITAGRGGAGSRGNASVTGESGYRNQFTATPAVGGSSGTGTALGGGGGGGGSAYGPGGAGANGIVNGTGSAGTDATNYGAGGGGGGGVWLTASGPGGKGGKGMEGYIRLSW